MKSEQKMKSPQGDMIATTINKGYKTFDGILMPSEMITETGQQTIKIVIDTTEINKNVSDTDFK